MKNLPAFERLTQPLLFAVTAVILFAGFFANTWRVVEPESFAGFHREFEGVVMSRLVQSRQHGIFSAAGLQGASVAANIHEDWLTRDQAERQFAAFLQGSGEPTAVEFVPYLSRPGCEAMVYGLLDHWLPGSPETRLVCLYGLTALLSSIVLALVVLWFFCEFGSCVALFVGLSMVFSQWLTVYGRILWWNLWSFYLPMLACMWFLRRERRTGTGITSRLAGLLGAALLIKCLMNGFEYITATLVMMVVPMAYYGRLRRWSFRTWAWGILVAGIGSGLAIAIALVILLLQISLVKGGLPDAVGHVIDSLVKRTYGGAESFSPVFKDSLDASTVSVLLIYLKGTFFDFRNYLSETSSGASRIFFRLRYLDFICLAALLSLTRRLFRRAAQAPQTGEEARSQALLLAMWVSLLAPLSWFVIFKSHSYLHTHMNYILWQMPFTFFCFAVFGDVVHRMRLRLKGGLENARSGGARLALLAAVVLVGVCLSAAIPAWLAFEKGRSNAEDIEPLRDELLERGAQLTLAVAPYYSLALLEDYPGFYTFKDRFIRSWTLRGWKSAGYEVIDLCDPLLGLAKTEGAMRDATHLSETGSESLAMEFADRFLPERGAELDDRTKILVMGECYAVDLALGLGGRSDAAVAVDALRSYGDPMRAVELLFRFEDTHLVGTDIVVWFLPEELAIWGDVSGYRIPEPTVLDDSVFTVQAEVLTDIGYDYLNWEDARRRMVYQDYLGEVHLRLSSPIDGVPDELVLVNYCARQKKRTEFVAIHAGDTVVVTITDYNTFIQTHKKVAQEAYLTAVDDYELPRYWLLEWTKTNYQPGQL